MADQLIVALGDTLDEIAQNIHDGELMRKLKGLSTNDGTNYATLERPTRSPRRAIKILPAPAVGPDGSTKICDGKLTIGGNEIAVSAFRLA
jgi:hypothetical protein